MKLLVVSICKDESATIGEVLDRIPRQIVGVDQIEKWVIDDGSTDDTISAAKDHGAEVISDGTQKRLAFRFRQATELALARGADIMVNIDGDLQFNPIDIPKLISPILNDEADFVAANRFINHETGEARRPEGMAVGKYYGNKIGAKVVSRLSDHNFSDVTCGFRAYNREALYALNINNTYTYTQESFQVLAMKKLRIVTMPVHITYYKGRKSRVVRSFWGFIFGSAVNILRAYRDYAPFRFFGELGLYLFIPSILLMGFVLARWIVTGSLSPYKAFGIVGLYLFTMSLFVWALGLVADMMDRMLNNQERIIERLKRLEYEDKKEGEKYGYARRD